MLSFELHKFEDMVLKISHVKSHSFLNLLPDEKVLFSKWFLIGVIGCQKTRSKIYFLEVSQFMNFQLNY